MARNYSMLDPERFNSFTRQVAALTAGLRRLSLDLNELLHEPDGNRRILRKKEGEEAIREVRELIMSAAETCFGTTRRLLAELDLFEAEVKARMEHENGRPPHSGHASASWNSAS